MSEYRDMPMIDLYSTLGYEKRSSRRKFEALDAATQSFYREYTRQGNFISKSRVDTVEARLCALSFLEEDGRGERFWPLNSEGVLAWPTHREVITDLLQNIFRRKAYSDYVSKRKEIRCTEGDSNQKPKRVRKRPRKLKDEDEDGIESQPMQNEDEFIPSSLEPTTVKPWNDPPAEPAPLLCVKYIQSLNPQHDSAPVAEFHSNWLSAEYAKWPISADNRLLRFMFDNNLFMDYDHGDELSAELHMILRQGTEIEEMDASEVNSFRNRVKERVKELTSQLTKKPYFILAYRRDGVVRMTERFERMWKKKEVYWEDDSESSNLDGAKPAKKCRKSKAIRAKTPIGFPNLREQDEMRSRMQLTSIAESALEFSSGHEEQERRAEGSFFADAMNVFPDPEHEITYDAPVTEQSSTRGASPRENIVVESAQTGGQSPNTTTSFSPSRQDIVSEKQASRSPTVEPTPSLNGVSPQPLKLGAAVPIQPGSAFPSEGRIAEAEQIAIIAANEEYIANNKQEKFDQLLTSMRELTETGKSRAFAGQNMSPVESTASPILGNLESMSAYTLSSQYRQQPISPGSDDADGAILPMWHAGFKWPGSQRLTATVAADSMDESPIQDGNQTSTSTPGHGQCEPSYMLQRAKNLEPKNSSYGASISNRPGSSRSSPVEIEDDSDNTASPRAGSPKETFMPTNRISPEAGKRRSEPIGKVAGVQSNYASPLSPTYNNLHNLPGDEIDNRTATQQYQYRISKETQAPSVAQPQITNVQQGPLPSQDLVNICESPSPQLPQIRGSTGWKHHFLAYELPRTPFVESPLNNISPSSPKNTSNEALKSPLGGGISKRKGSPSPPRPPNEVQRPKLPGPPRPSSNSNVVPVEELQDTWTHWSTRDGSASKSNSVTSEIQGKNTVQASHTPPSKTSPLYHDTTNVLTQQDESVEKGLRKTFPACQRALQIGDKLSQDQSVFSPPLDSTNKTATMNNVESQRSTEAQTSPRFSETDEPLETSSAAVEFPGSLNIDSSTTGRDIPSVVDDFIKETDEFITEARGCGGVQRENSSEPSNPPHQPSQPEPPKPQGGNSPVKASMSEPLLIRRSPVIRAFQSPSPSQDLMPAPEKRVTPATQEPITPPAETTTPDRRNGFYSFVPPPLPFSPYKSTTNPPPTSNHPTIPLSTDTRLATATTPSPTIPKLTMLIESADGNMSLETTHPFEIVMHSSLSEFFQFYASVSGTPLSSLTSLTFLAAFGKSQCLVVRRYGGESAWMRLKVVMPTLFKEAVRRDREGKMEWPVLVSGE